MKNIKDITVIVMVLAVVWHSIPHVDDNNAGKAEQPQGMAQKIELIRQGQIPDIPHRKIKMVAGKEFVAHGPAPAGKHFVAHGPVPAGKHFVATGPAFP